MLSLFTLMQLLPLAEDVPSAEVRIFSITKTVNYDRGQEWR